MLNATISRYAYAVIKTLDEPVVRFVATDQQIEEVIAADALLLINGKLRLHKAVYKHMVQHFNGGKVIPMELSTFCDAPIGSGLGASSMVGVARYFSTGTGSSTMTRVIRRAQKTFNSSMEFSSSAGKLGD